MITYLTLVVADSSFLKCRSDESMLFTHLYNGNRKDATMNMVSVNDGQLRTRIDIEDVLEPLSDNK